MVEEHITGIIKDIDENGTLTILAGVPSVERALLRQYKTCSIILEDGRHITPKQRAKCYALLGEIDEYVNGLRTAEGQEEQKNLLKLRFMLDCMTEAERKMFSLADCSETTARAFITYIIDFIVRSCGCTNNARTSGSTSTPASCTRSARCAAGAPTSITRREAASAWAATARRRTISDASRCRSAASTTPCCTICRRPTSSRSTTSNPSRSTSGFASFTD